MALAMTSLTASAQTFQLTNEGYFNAGGKVTLSLLIGVVLVAELAGGLGELALMGGIETTIQDFTIGWPGLLLQIIGAYFVCKYL